MPEKNQLNETEAREALDGARDDQSAMRERHLDKTIEDSFPASDPPSTDPNPAGRE